jgi:hypothetical protein
MCVFVDVRGLDSSYGALAFLKCRYTSADGIAQTRNEITEVESFLDSKGE